MIGRVLSFPLVELAIEAPAAVLAELAAFYPRSLRDRPRGVVAHHYRVERQGVRLALLRDRVILGSFDAVLPLLLTLELEVETQVVAHAAGRIALHAGAVDVGARGCLVAGHQDTGKTTTTLHLVELGHAQLCDEVCLVAPGTWAVEPFPQSLALAPEMLRLLERELGLAAGDVRELPVPVWRYLPRRVAEAPVPADTILVPSYDPEGPSRMEPLEPGDALPEMLGYCYPPEGDDERLFDDVIGLLEACRLLRFRYAGPAAARGILEELFPAP